MIKLFKSQLFVRKWILISKPRLSSGGEGVHQALEGSAVPTQKPSRPVSGSARAFCRSMTNPATDYRGLMELDEFESIDRRDPERFGVRRRCCRTGIGHGAWMALGPAAPPGGALAPALARITPFSQSNRALRFIQQL